MWEKIKDYSNYPEPGTCPIKAVSCEKRPNSDDQKQSLSIFQQGHYYLKDYIHNGERFKAIMRPGMMRIDMFVSQDQGDSHIIKNGVRIFAMIEEKS
jgi:hypothetical protein